MKVSFLILCLSLFAATAKAEVGETRFGVSAPLMLLDGNAFWGGNLIALYQLDNNWEVGGETGFHTRSTSISSASGSTWVIPIMPTVLYNFDMNTPKFTPFVGLGLGVGISRSSLSFLGFDVSNTDVNFEGLVHLGAKFGASKNLFTDMKLGLLDDTFIFLPSIGWFF